MSNTFSKKADSYLKASHGDLGTLLKKITVLNELSNRLSTFLDEHTRKYCQVSNLTGTTLTLIAANGSVATQLRFQMPDLLRKFKSDAILKRIQTIECKVRPPKSLTSSQKSTNSNPVMRKLSTETAEFIKEMAKSIDDVTLRDALEKIAKNIK
jgi:hypothetical protein